MPRTTRKIHLLGMRILACAALFASGEKIMLASDVDRYLFPIEMNRTRISVAELKARDKESRHHSFEIWYYAGDKGSVFGSERGIARNGAHIGIGSSPEYFACRA